MNCMISLRWQIHTQKKVLPFFAGKVGDCDLEAAGLVQAVFESLLEAVVRKEFTPDKSINFESEAESASEIKPYNNFVLSQNPRNFRKGSFTSYHIKQKNF